MFALFQLVLRRSLRNAPLTLAVLVGLVVLVTLLVAAPLYTSALADVGLRATLADAPLDERSVRATLPVRRVDRAEYERLASGVAQAARAADWLRPQVLGAVRTKRLHLPGNDAARVVTLVEADDALENVLIVDGRLPRPGAHGAPVEVVLGVAAAEQFEVAVGDVLGLAERASGESFATMLVSGLVEPADPAASFWQSGVLDLEPVVSATREEAALLVPAGTIFDRIVPRLPSGRASGEYRWRTIFDTDVVDGGNADRAEADVARVVRDTARVLPEAEVLSDFGGIVEGYRQRLSVARLPILLLLCEIAGLALIYVAWTAAFQAEASADERAVMGARGAGIRQILALSGGEAALLALGAGVTGIPLALLLLRATASIGPVGDLARAQGLRLVATPAAGNYAAGAAFVGLLALMIPAVPAARQSIVALRQGGARPPTAPLWQRMGLDVMVAVVAIVALLQLQREGGMLREARGRFVVDPFLLVAPLLVLVAGALLFLRLLPIILNLTRRLAARPRGLLFVLALVQLTRNRAASTRLVLLLTLAVALGLFAQTFGATVALNQQQRAGYVVGADARAILTSTEPLVPGALPPHVRGAWAFRGTVRAAGERGSAGTLLAVDPADFAVVAFNPPDRPVAPVDEVLAGLGPEPAPDGLVLPDRARTIEVDLQLDDAPLAPAVMLGDAAGRFHRLRLQPLAEGHDSTRFVVSIDLPPEVHPLRLVALALLPDSGIRWGIFELAKPPFSVSVGAITVDNIAVETWQGDTVWTGQSDTNFDPLQEQAGVIELGNAEAGRQSVEITLGRGMRAVLLRPNAQDVEPIPVRVNRPFLEANNLEAGDTALFYYRTRPVLVEIGGVIERFPSLGVDGAPFVVAHGPRLLRLLNTSYFTSVTPNELWLDLPDDAAADAVGAMGGIGTLTLQTAALRSFSRDPLAVGIAGVFFLGFVSSVALTAIGFAIATYLAGRRRVLEFAVLQAIGLDRRAVLGVLALEQAVLVLLALVAGTVLGAALGRLILPLMAVSDRGHAAVPPYQIVVPWTTLGLTYLALLAVFAAMTVLVLWLLLRRGIGSALRIGES